MSIAGVGESVAERLGDTSQKAADDILARVGDVDNRLRTVGENLLSRIGGTGRRSDRANSDFSEFRRRGDRRPRRPGGDAPCRREPSLHETPLALTPTTSLAASTEAARGRSRRSRDMAKRLPISSPKLRWRCPARSATMATNLVGRIGASNAEAIEAIRTHRRLRRRSPSRRPPPRPATPSRPTRTTVVNRVSASSAEAAADAAHARRYVAPAYRRPPKRSTRTATRSPPSSARRRP